MTGFCRTIGATDTTADDPRPLAAASGWGSRLTMGLPTVSERAFRAGLTVMLTGPWRRHR